MMADYKYLDNGGTFHMRVDNILRHKCCDCGALHDWQIRHEKGRFRITVRRTEEEDGDKTVGKPAGGSRRGKDAPHRR